MQAAVESCRAVLEDFDEVVRLYWRCVHRFILASVRDADAAQTLTQDCSLRAYSARGAFRSQANVKTWLMHIAVNLVRDFGRNRRLQFWKRLNAPAANPGDVGDHLPVAAVSPEDQALLREKVQIVQQYRLKLIDLNATVQKEEVIMEPLVSAEVPDEAKIVAQIDKVAQARAELEKANARMLLGIRRLLTQEQWNKLKSETPRITPQLVMPAAPSAR